MIIERKIVKDNCGGIAINTVVKRKSGKIQNYFIAFKMLKNQKKSEWLKYYENEIKKGINNSYLEQHDTVLIRGNIDGLK